MSSKNKSKAGKAELKALGAQRPKTGDDFTSLENPDDFGTVTAAQAAVNLGADEVHRERADTGAPDDESVHGGEDEGEEETVPAAQPVTGAKLQFDKLERNYLAAAIDSLRRVPATGLSEQFRARLLTYRHFIGELTRRGVKGEARLVAAVVSTLAVDGTGKIDAVVFLRQLMGQIMWLGSMDVTRLRRPPRERDSYREPPYGMADMSDHSDAIAGLAGPDTNPTAEMNEIDVFNAVEGLHGFLTAVADTLADNEDERLFLRLESGLSFVDERVPDPAMPGGARWEPVYDLHKAMDLQLVKNQEALVRREQQRAERRTKQLSALANLYTE